MYQGLKKALAGVLWFAVIFSTIYPASAIENTLVNAVSSGTLKLNLESVNLGPSLNTMEQQLATWFKTSVQNRAANLRSSFEEFIQILNAPESSSSTTVNSNFSQILSGLKTSWIGKYSKLTVDALTTQPSSGTSTSKSLFSVFTQPQVTLESDVVADIDPTVLSITTQADRILSALPNDSQIDVNRVGPVVRLAARAFFAKWLTQSGAIGVHSDGSYNALLLKEKDSDGVRTLDPAFINYFVALESNQLGEAVDQLSEMAALLSQIPCSDLGRMAKKYDETILQTHRQLAGKNFVFQNFYNGLLPVSNLLAELTVNCKMDPAVSHFQIPSPSGTGTLLEYLSHTRGFSLNHLFYTLDLQSFRLRGFNNTELPNKAEFMMNAFGAFNDLAGICSSEERIMAGLENFTCPRCEPGTDSGSLAAGTTTFTGTEVTGTSPTWGSGCSGGSSGSSGSSGGSSFGNLGQCYGSSLRSYFGGAVSGETTSIFACTLSEVGTGGVQLNMDPSVIPGSGRSCQGGLVSTNGINKVTPNDSVISTMERRSDRAANAIDRRAEQHRDMAGRRDPIDISRTEARSAYHNTVEQIRIGVIEVQHVEGVNYEDNWVSSEDGRIIYVDDEGMASLGTTLSNAATQLTYESVERNHSWQPPSLEEWESQGRGSQMCDAGTDGCGSGCNMVPAVIQRFKQCLSAGDSRTFTTRLWDPCRFGRCQDTSSADDFAGSCTPSVSITSNGCETVNCPTSGLTTASLGATTDTTQISRCCSGASGSGTTTSVTDSFIPGGVFDPCRFMQGGQCGSADGGILPGTGDAPGGVPPIDPGNPE